MSTPKDRFTLVWGCALASSAACADSEPLSVAADAGGAAIVDLASAAVPTAMVSDGSTLFWLDRSMPDSNGQEVATRLQAVATEGGSARTLATGKFVAASLAHDAAGLYFIQAGASSFRGDVYRVAKSGGTPQRLSEGAGDATAVTVRGDVVYWWTETVPTAASYMARLVGKTGQGAPTTIAQTTSGQAALSASRLAVTATGAFIAAAGVRYVPLTVPSVMGTSVFCGGFAADDANAFCADVQSGEVLQLSTDGSKIAIAQTTPNSAAAVVDATSVFIAHRPGMKEVGDVVKYARMASGSSVIAAEGASALAIDSNAVYWATTDGRIRRMAK